MSMEMYAMSSMWRAMHDDGKTKQRSFSRVTARRILTFAQPHRRALAAFLALSVVSALLTVATPLLAGHVVDGIIEKRSTGVVVGLAAVIAIIAVADAVLGVINRALSSRIGEGLIFHLRTAVFDHVQKMPVAFFTRTRTGALVSRLNNDVIGAQRAFSSVLSGVVANTVTLLLTVAVMA